MDAKPPVVTTAAPHPQTPRSGLPIALLVLGLVVAMPILLFAARFIFLHLMF